MGIFKAAIQDPELAQKMISDDKYRVILKTLAQHKSMPFLELASVSDMDDETLQGIVKDLERGDIVKVSNPENVLEEIITLKDKGFALA